MRNGSPPVLFISVLHFDAVLWESSLCFLVFFLIEVHSRDSLMIDLNHVFSAISFVSVLNQPLHSVAFQTPHAFT